MPTPTPGQLRLAAEWLLEYEGGGDATERDCHAVARWLPRQADAGELRALARAARLPVAAIRQRLEHAA